jgi:Tol biopolymer transport system component
MPSDVRRRRGLAFRVAPVLLVGAAVLGAPAVAMGAFPGENGRIAITSTWLGSCADASAISTLRPDGRAVRQVTRCGAWYSAEWFLHGRRLLAGSGLGVAVMWPDGSHRRWIDVPGREPVFAASPSAGGSAIAYLQPPRDSSDMSAQSEIWRARLDGSGARHIGDGWMPRWSPDGRRIAFAGDAGVSVMSAAGRRVRVLVPGFHPGSIDWSPDGRRLAYTGCCPSAVWTVRTTGPARPRRMLLPTAPSSLIIEHVAWSPDGRRLAFTGMVRDDEEAEYSIWTVTPRGASLRRIQTSGYLDSELNRQTGLSWGPRP